jgi:hypothetical protein
MKSAINKIKNPEHIRDIVVRSMKRIKETTRIVVRCHVCDKIYLAKPDSDEHKLRLCDTCLKAYGHIYGENSDHDV